MLGVKKYEMSREQTAPVGRTHYQTDSPFDYDPVRFLYTKKRECQFKNEPLPTGHKKIFRRVCVFSALQSSRQSASGFDTMNPIVQISNCFFRVHFFLQERQANAHNIPYGP